MLAVLRPVTEETGAAFKDVIIYLPVYTMVGTPESKLILFIS